MRTIIQHIGPLLGEVNTGSVFGQPNGSIANGQGFSPAPAPSPGSQIPTVFSYDYWRGMSAVNPVDPYKYIKTIINSSGQLVWYSSRQTTTSTTNGPVGQLSVIQTISDNTAHVTIQLSTDSNFTEIIGYETYSAGTYPSSISQVRNPTLKTTAGTTYYARAVLVAEDGTIIGKSNTLEFTGVAA